MNVPDNTLLAAVVRLLAERLPPKWNVERASVPDFLPMLRFSAPSGQFGDLAAFVQARLDPRSALSLPAERPLLVVAPYLSRRVREVLEQQGLSYADKTGNVRVILDKPGLFILTAGADTNPWPDERRFTLRGAKAGQVASALAKVVPPVGVRELAGAAGTDPGYVSRLLVMLDREAIVDRSARGQVERVDWRKLLERWADDAPLESRTTASSWLAPRGLAQTFDALRSADFPYVVTGSAAAARFAPVAPTRLASVYVEDAELAAKVLGLRATDAGANVTLLQPEDPAIFEHAVTADGLKFAALPLVVADLLSGPGRSPTEAAALLDWMAEHAEVWRG